MSVKPPDDFIPANIDTRTASGGGNILGENVSEGKSKKRITLKIFDEVNESVAQVRVRVLPGKKEDQEKAVKELSTSFWKWGERQRWVPLKIKQDGQKEEQIVLVNINSLASRLGISKTFARKMAAEGDASGLGKMLNEMRRLREALPNKEEGLKGSATFNKDLAVSVLKTVNYIENNRDKLVAASRVDPRVYHPTNNTDSLKFIVHEDGKISIHLYELGKGMFKTVNATFEYQHLGKVAYSQLSQQMDESQKAQDKAYAEMDREKRLSQKFNSRGLVKTYAFRMLKFDPKQDLVKSEPVIVQKCYNKNLKNSAKLSPEDLRKMFDDTSHGLKFLHDQGYAHRDIKLDNIFLDTENGQVKEAVLGDFGLAVAENDDLDDSMQGFCGTLAYLSPALFRYQMRRYTKDIDVWKTNDIWSLGCTWYQALTGNFPPWIKPNENRAAYVHKMVELAEYDNNSKIRKEFCADLEKHLKENKDITPLQRKLLIGMLNPDPYGRLNIDQVRILVEQMYTADQKEIKAQKDQKEDFPPPPFQ